MIFEYQPVTYRHEMKHRINPLEAQILTSRFDVLFQQDKYSQKDGNSPAEVKFKNGCWLVFLKERNFAFVIIIMI